MERNYGIFLHCPAHCGMGLSFSRHHLRRTRSLVWNWPRCGHKETIDVGTKPELLAEILVVSIGENRQIDARNVSQATADQSTSTITLHFHEGERMEIGTSRFVADLETLETCGVAVVE